jgi:protein-S-isoprenylcysteine O-methyltransferase Ste14
MEFNMPRLALAALIAYFALAFGLRSFIHWRRTGTSGFKGISGAAGSAEWMGGVLFVVALVAAVAAPLADLGGAAASWPALAGAGTRIAGTVCCLAGIAGTLWAQLAMGDSWRVGVDERERTTLVASGPFRLVRNPIYTSMLLGMGGVALLTPNVVAAVAMSALAVALELQVRRVEEPHLLRAHDGAYQAYAARTGRFLPGIGRLTT